MEEKDSEPCSLCGRPLAEPCNRHHLTPLSKGGRNTPTILLHKICHDKIHAVFTEMELKRFYHTMDRLRQHEAMRKFIRWVRNKDPQFYDKSVRMKK
ncbi:MAG TPA: HNH endonuclease [Chitinophagaceae bacterium]|jgi:5-methylcytosine-specific restriction endonuclease McrA|nr:HNH endonuclease [Chitinophagaceae bacterium]